MWKPQEVDDVTMAFPANVDGLLPAWEDIPKEFWRFDGTRWNSVFNDWFYSGLRNPEFTAKDGIDPAKAVRHLKAIMGSYQPQHEHKEAGCSYLMSLWFTDVTYEKAKQP